MARSAKKAEMRRRRWRRVSLWRKHGKSLFDVHDERPLTPKMIFTGCTDTLCFQPHLYGHSSSIQDSWDKTKRATECYAFHWKYGFQDMSLKCIAIESLWRGKSRFSLPGSMPFSSVALLFSWGILIAILITVILRATEPYSQWDPLTFQDWKVPYEMAALIVIWVPSTALIFAGTYTPLSRFTLYC